MGDATSVGVPAEGRRGIGAPGVEVSVVCWEPNSGSLQELQVPFAEPSPSTNILNP